MINPYVNPRHQQLGIASPLERKVETESGKVSKLIPETGKQSFGATIYQTWNQMKMYLADRRGGRGGQGRGCDDPHNSRDKAPENTGEGQGPGLGRRPRDGRGTGRGRNRRR